MKTIVKGASILSRSTSARKEAAFGAALSRMPDAQAMKVVLAAEVICARVRIATFGELAALELLAALGVFLGKNGKIG